MVHTDQIIKNEKEELLSKNEEGTGYVLKMWYPWPECSVSSIGDLGQAEAHAKAPAYKTGESAV